jgi:hypothetical protein
MSRAERTRRKQLGFWDERAPGLVARTIATSFISAILLAPLVSPTANAAGEPSGSAPDTTAEENTRSETRAMGPQRQYREIRIEPLELIEAVEAVEPTEPDAIVDALPYDPRSSGITPDDLDRIQRYFRSAFEDELKHAFEVTSKSGPQTLHLEAILIGLELDRQAWLAPASFLFKTVNTVTLVVIVIDSVTGEVVQRLAIKDGPVANRLQLDNASLYWEHLRRLFRRLAIRTRWLLADPPEERAQ